MGSCGDASKVSPIALRYGAACQHAYPVPARQARNPNAPRPATARSKPKTTPVAPIRPYPTTGASSPAASARPMTGASHPGAASDASGGFIKSLRNAGISGPSSSARTTRRCARRVGDWRAACARAAKAGRRETPERCGRRTKKRVLVVSTRAGCLVQVGWRSIGRERNTDQTRVHGDSRRTADGFARGHGACAGGHARSERGACDGGHRANQPRLARHGVRSAREEDKDGGEKKKTALIGVFER